MTFDPNTYMSGLSRSLPPIKEQTTESFQSNAYNLANAILNQFVKENKISSGMITPLSNLFSSMFLCDCLTIGDPKESTGNFIQHLVAAATLQSYFANLSYFVGLVPSFVTNFVQVTMSHIQGQATEAEFTASAFQFVGFVSTIVTIGTNADVELQFIPKSYQIPEVKPQVEILHQVMMKCIADGDAIRAKHAAGQPSTQEEAVLAQSLQTLNTTANTLAQTFSQLAASLKTHFNSSFAELELEPLQTYAQTMSQTMISICFISLRVALYNPGSFEQIIQVLQMLQNHIFTTISSLFTLARLHGEIDQLINGARTANDQMKTIFEPLLQALIAAIPQCPVPFQNSVNTILVPLFQGLQGLNSDFEKKLNVVLCAIPSNKRFFMYLGKNPANDKSKTVFPVLNVFLNLVNDVNSEKLPPKVEEITQQVNHELQPFLNHVSETISGNDDIQVKARLLEQRDAILSAYEKYTFDLSTYLQHPDNEHLKFQSYLRLMYVVICICSVDYHPDIAKMFSMIPQLFAHNTVSYFIVHLKSVLDAAAFIMQRSGDIPKEAFNGFVGVFNVFMGVVRSSSGVFRGANPTSDTQVAKCLIESDTVYLTLYSLYSSLSNVDIPSDLVAAAQLIGMVGSNVRLCSELHRASLQLQYKMKLEPLAKRIIPFAETVSLIGLAQGFDHFKDLKTKVINNANAVLAVLADQPPPGAYDESFTNRLCACGSAICQPAFQMVKDGGTVLGNNVSENVKIILGNFDVWLTEAENLTPFLGKIQSNKEAIVPSFVGYVMKSDLNQLSNAMAQLLSAFQENRPDASVAANKIVYHASYLATAIDFVSSLRSVSDTLRDNAKALGRRVSEYSVGDKSKGPQIVQEISDMFEVCTKLKVLSQSYIKSSQIYGKETSDKL
ncbi:hypothetical protein TRFO_01584 [Tritrichomonas foetus]|uniref:Uncharacterized protein n=1 Tax=Tritrichomonas foetus TaxID=1144522 RepID=A0A1J4JYT6_9EUKA|nr:hypothetical protein TRFO_01584 [Tritrichomonas foetus]|eukprot:OHT03858.1 hypothetical protein TRFO_01584 [Tritrichomonas foetus]